MTHPDHAGIWADTIRTARTLDPPTIAARIVAQADNGLRAARYDSGGSRTTFVECEDPERCHDGPGGHRHQVTNDPTGNSAVGHLTGRSDDGHRDELRRLNLAAESFVESANVVLDWVAGVRCPTWHAATFAACRLMPGTVQAGLEVDDEYRLPPAIAAAERSVATVAAVSRHHLPRNPSDDERHWTAGMADEDCCDWHQAIHRRYRRPRLPGKNICQDCVSLATLGGRKPPAWLLEAEVDRAAKPKAWTLALGRWLDDLGIREPA